MNAFSPLKNKNYGNMLPEVDAIVENFTDIDENVFSLWIKGLSISEAVSEILETAETKEWGAAIPPHCSLEKIVTIDTRDHYHTFTELEKILITPQKLAEDCTHQMSASDQTMLITKFYSLDDCVVREIIGKKLSGRNRKDLDDVADKTAVLLRSCRRQFDNIKRVFKQVEDAPGPLLSTIQSCFLLPDALTRKYAAIVFLLLNRFETSKKKLNYVTFEDLYKCAFAVMDHWSAAAGSTKQQQHTSDDGGIDRDFLMLLRELKCLLEREKEHKSLSLCELRRSGGCPVAEAEAHFKLLSRPLCAIAIALHTPKELRDLFVDVVERVVDPLRTVKWNSEQVEGFLAAFTSAGAVLLDCSANVRSTWQSYMKVMSICVVQLHHL